MLILCFQSFGLGVSAASDNLISSDLTTWQDVSNLEDNVFPINVAVADNIYRVTLTDQEFSVYFGAIIDQTSLIAGHSYSLSFKMPGRTEINTAFSKSYSASVFENHFTNSELFIGIGYISSSGEVSLPESSTLYQINKDNYTKYFGKTLKASFIASSYTGTPVVIINICSLDGTDHSFYFSDFKLIDNDDNSAELTGIKGFLHSIRWDLVGGTCEEEDCPHSSGDNPHLSLSERMSSGFASMFQTIGDKFEEGSTLNVWFNGLSDKVGSINGSLSGLGDRINGFFSGLGDRISGFFSNLGDRMSGFFTNLGTSIGGFFSDLKTNMSNWFSELGNKITTKFQEIGDKFTEFFEKFKPRVNVNLNWVRGYINGSTGIISPSSTFAIVSEPFKVDSGVTYKLSYIKDNTVMAGVYRYSLDGEFIDSTTFTKAGEDLYFFSSSYIYRFMVRDNGVLTDLSVLNEVVYIYADEGWINALLFNMKNGLKNLFVPDEQVITDLKTNFDNLLRDHLGIIYTCTDLFSDFLTKAFTIIFEAPETYQIKIPEVSFEAGGTTVPVFSAQNIDFSFMDKPVFKTMYSMYKVALYILFGGLEVKYALATYRKVINN